ncbi:MAG: peptidoglycan DD-metalloendopeptidase family protein [Oscillospiraceae bacterium]|nr:peptidoglycan DD-metalloendopeptidase family protein [Oscillospiraceae bacterium]
MRNILITPKIPVFKNGRHYVTYGFMAPEYGSPHKGMDIVPGAVGVESDILAITDGIIESVKDTVSRTIPLTPASNWKLPDVLGNFIVIRHSERFTSRYCHLKYGSIKVKTGSRIKAGQVIATIGNTGLSSAPHLHFEISEGNTRINPLPFLMGEAKLKATDNPLPAPSPKPITDPTVKSLETLAAEVINGDWGNGEERAQRLTEAGYDARTVQARVNEILYGKK